MLYPNMLFHSAAEEVHASSWHAIWHAAMLYPNLSTYIGYNLKIKPISISPDLPGLPQAVPSPNLDIEK